jgi:nanoRNase/pAp phosphatase (c-di-AMP/oligoRNAs hydrolase)
MESTRPRRSQRLLRALAGRQVAIVTHDNPDPDAIASGWGLVVLLRKTNNQVARLLGRGAIVRAENVHMLRLLQPPLELVEDLPADGTAIVLVDCLPTGTNQPLDRSPVRPLAVIDHHEPHGDNFRVAYRDLRPRVAATASIVAGYLREQGIMPERDLATALLFAIRTELFGHCVSLTRTDRGMLSWLSGLADYSKLAEIESAPLSRDYFSDLLLALENVFIYEDTSLCFLPQASGAEIVGEVADLLIRCQGIGHVLCGAAVKDDLILSARSTNRGGNVLELLSVTVSGLGHCGGHRQRAGGRIAGVRRDGAAPEALYDTLRERWLAACKVDQQRGVRLVRKRVILEHL